MVYNACIERRCIMKDLKFNKIKTAEILSDLRHPKERQKPYSYAELSKKIFEKTGVHISHTQLCKYENNELSGKDNDIMNIKNACAIANFYEVSLDYILGISEAKTNDIDVKTICEKTGLSAECVNMLLDNENVYRQTNCMDDLSYFLSDFSFVMIVVQLCRYRLLGRAIEDAVNKNPDLELISFELIETKTAEHEREIDKAIMALFLDLKRKYLPNPYYRYLLEHRVSKDKEELKNLSKIKDKKDENDNKPGK